MNGHSDPLFPGAGDSLLHSPFPDVIGPSPFSSVALSDQLAVNDQFETLRLLSSDVISDNSYSSSFGSSVVNYATQRPSFIQRSVSSHSLQKNGSFNDNNNNKIRPVSELPRFLESESPGRRVYSTGDLQGKQSCCYGRSESPLSIESSMIIEEMSRAACRYSPEEKKERIERYKSKRNQRNFNKKIKYICRKTLADSRPRIRGRFARNEEIDQKNSPELQEWSQASCSTADQDSLDDEVHDDDDNYWINFLDSFSNNLVP